MSKIASICALLLMSPKFCPPRRTRSIRTTIRESFPRNQQPVLRMHSGDTVITKTWDSGGQDQAGVRHLQHPYVYPESGNPLMGPFYIEEADLGDALEVHLDKVRLNRNWGYTAYRLSPDILTSSAAEAPV